MPKKSSKSSPSSAKKGNVKKTRSSKPKKKTAPSPVDKRSQIIGIMLMMAAVILTMTAVVNRSTQTSQAQAGDEQAVVIAPLEACVLTDEEETDLPACDLRGSSPIQVKSVGKCETSCPSEQTDCVFTYDGSTDILQDAEGSPLTLGTGYAGCQ